MKYKIPFSKPYVGIEEVAAITKVIQSGNLVGGGVVEEFERNFADYVGSQYAVALGSCSAALHIAVAYQKSKEPQHSQRTKVLVPSLTFSSTASATVNNNLEPVFVDVEKDGRFCVNLDNFYDSADVLLKIPVALTGNEIKIENKNRVVIDSAHRIRRDDGKDGITRCFSFHPTKEITTGFGGMLTTDDAELYLYAKKARIHGIAFKGDKTYGYQVEFVGWKMNMTDMTANMGIEQLKKLDFMTAERQRCVDRYNKNLGLNRTGLHLYPIFVENREQFISAMEDAGIECSIHFAPLHLMPAYRAFNKKELPNSEYYGARVVSLPLFPELTNQEIDEICQKVATPQSLLLE